MPEIFRLTIGNASLVGQHSGEGKPLIFLHAGVADQRMWDQQVVALQNSYQVITYDRRGFGKTTSPNEAFSHVEDLRGVFNQLGISVATLVGCSQGGRIAIDFALTYPQLVSALMLLAPAVTGAPEPAVYPPEIQAHLDELDAAEKANNIECINAIEANLWLDGPTSRAGRVRGATRKLFLDMNGIALKMPELTQEHEPSSAYERLANLSLPTLVVWGELDFPHIQQRCRYLVDTIPAAIGRKIRDAAHLINLEQPHQINELLREWLMFETSA